MHTVVSLDTFLTICMCTCAPTGHGANGALEGADVLASALEKAGGTAASPGQVGGRF